MTSFAKETLPISLEEEMRRSYLDYAMSVIVGRALPDARDHGLALRPSLVLHRALPCAGRHQAFLLARQLDIENRAETEFLRHGGDTIDADTARDLALGRFGRVDVVMNTPGIVVCGPVLAIPFEEWQRSIEVNLLSIVRSNEVFLPLLLEQSSGHVVNTASMAGLSPLPGAAPYAATKYAVVGISETMREELRGTKVGVSVLCPGFVKTNIFHSQRNRPQEAWELFKDFGKELEAAFGPKKFRDFVVPKPSMAIP